MNHSATSSFSRQAITCSALLALVAVAGSACSKQPAKDAPAAKAPEAAKLAAATPAAPAHNYATVDQRVSYGIGFKVGSNLANEKAIVIDQEALKAGIADAMAGKKPVLSDEELQAAFTEAQQKAAAAAAAVGEKTKAASVEFLAKNKTRPGVITTASGLQYEVITSGTGAKPKPTDTVEVHYHGTLIDGTVFDSSVERGETISFPVTGVIPGWIEALQLMSVGDKWKLYVPAELAYRDRNSPKIPAHSALIFEVQLISIK